MISELLGGKTSYDLTGCSYQEEVQRANGLLARLNDRLRAKVRQAAGKRTQPTAASLDSQTVRASAHGGEVGYDAAKKTKGRKRFLLVDTLGLLLGVTLEPADCPERQGARTLLATVLADYPQLLKLWVDGGFSGPEFAAWVQTQHPTLVVEVVKRCLLYTSPSPRD